MPPPVPVTRTPPVVTDNLPPLPPVTQNTKPPVPALPTTTTSAAEPEPGHHPEPETNHVNAEPHAEHNGKPEPEGKPEGKPEPEGNSVSEPEPSRNGRNGRNGAPARHPTAIGVMVVALGAALALL